MENFTKTEQPVVFTKGMTVEFMIPWIGCKVSRGDRGRVMGVGRTILDVMFDEEPVVVDKGRVRPV